MYIPKDLKEKILIDGKEKTVEELIYAVRAHERQKASCRSYQKIRPKRTKIKDPS